MSDALILSILIVVAVGAAALSLLAWRKLGSRPEGEKSQFDSDDPAV